MNKKDLFNAGDEIVDIEIDSVTNLFDDGGGMIILGDRAQTKYGRSETLTRIRELWSE